MNTLGLIRSSMQMFTLVALSACALPWQPDAEHEDAGTKKAPSLLGSPSGAEVCSADASWFPHAQTPLPDSANFKPSSSCDFHRWSWQMFLWLTQDVNGQPRFLSFSTPYDILGIAGRDALLPSLNKSNSAHALDEYLQAGTEGILVDKNGHAVYYSQYVNDTFVSFIKTNKLHIPKNVRAFEPTTPFPIEALELKAAWKIVAPGEDASAFFTMPTRVHKLANRGGKIVLDTQQPLDVTVALVGFHIAGVVKDHPEMIWASFEHKENAPDVPINVKPSTSVSPRDWTFYQANQPYSACNINPARSSALKLDEKSQRLSPTTQVCRRYALGNDAEQQDMHVPGNIADVKSLNADVLTRLDRRSVWSNYFELGAIWFFADNALKPNMSLATDLDAKGDQLLIGSLRLSNSTVETFTQTQSTMNNCFRCHNTLQAFPPRPDLQALPAMNLNISHAFMNIYFWSQELAQQ